MHVPDHFLDPQTSIVTGVIAAGGIACALRSQRFERPDDHRVPLAGLVATFVFAAQMINFPVASGTSGHVLGAALAAVLVGPATAVVCLSGVLAVQAVFFADGGVTAFGTNVTLMALVGVVVGWVVFRALMRLLPDRDTSAPVAAAFGALVSVPAAAAVFAGLYAVGGQAHVDAGDLLVSMVGWHSLIGVGEAMVTGAVVAAVVAVRPDLVQGLRRRPDRATEPVPA